MDTQIWDSNGATDLEYWIGISIKLWLTTEIDLIMVDERYNSFQIDKQQDVDEEKQEGEMCWNDSRVERHAQSAREIESCCVKRLVTEQDDKTNKITSSKILRSIGSRRIVIVHSSPVV